MGEIISDIRATKSKLNNRIKRNVTTNTTNYPKSSATTSNQFKTTRNQLQPARKPLENICKSFPNRWRKLNTVIMFVFITIEVMKITVFKKHRNKYGCF